MYKTMIKTPFFSLRATLCTMLLLSPAVHAQACDAGWFGSLCQYKCHCTGNNCDNNGDCTNGAGCVKGWFGPQCQYVDLGYTENDGTTRELFRDADDTTCNADANHQTVIMSFRRTFPFTWLRLLVNTQGLPLDNIGVTFNDGSGNSNIQCSNRKSALINHHTIDIHCDVSVEVKKVSVTGVAIGHLCSFYISGGRNVALKQTTWQSTAGIGAPAKAVDGDTNQDFNKGGSCSHTEMYMDNNPNWSVTFSQNCEVNRFVIYNRGDCCPERLKGFTLAAFNENNAIEFTYQDEETTALSVYSVTSMTIPSPISSLDIRATNIAYPAATPILTLCEVEVYGDTVCPVGNYGRECEHKCHCANNDPCFVSTGMCSHGCATGYMGIHCDQPCPQGYYGANCQTECTDTCATKQCDITTGRCDQCPAGKTGDFCDQSCSSTTWGPRCVNPCSGTCKNHQCDAVTGKCDECPSGKTGDQCDQDCLPTQYGSRCVNTCSANCVNSHCSGDNGICDQCPAGNTGDLCDQTCSSTQWGPRCVNPCSRACKNQECDAMTGICRECPSEKTGDQCNQDCLHTQYGSRCVGTCSTNCVDSYCTGDNGRCDQCPAGKTGDLCNQNCPPTHYGPRCVNECSANCVNKTCERDTGRCIKCPSGMTGEMCDKECVPYTYGPRCIHNCSISCLNKLCDRVTGHCDECVNGKHGDFCDQVCPDGWYGDDCKKTCSINCKDSKQCDSVSGTCFDGCSDGYIGDLCEDECENGKYGSGCSSNCSDFCNTNGINKNESPCHHVSGTCLYGCVGGYEGLACYKEAQTSSSPDSEPGVGVGVGIGVGVTVLIGVAILGVYFYRRRQLDQKSRRERPPGYDPADPTTEDHNYNELFKSHDDYNLPTDEVSSSVTLHVPSKTSTVDNVHYVNADINADVNQYEDIDQVTSEIDQGRSLKAGENNSGYANC